MVELYISAPETMTLRVAFDNSNPPEPIQIFTEKRYITITAEEGLSRNLVNGWGGIFQTKYLKTKNITMRRQVFNDFPWNNEFDVPDTEYWSDGDDWLGPGRYSYSCSVATPYGIMAKWHGRYLTNSKDQNGFGYQPLVRDWLYGPHGFRLIRNAILSKLAGDVVGDTLFLVNVYSHDVFRGPLSCLHSDFFQFWRPGFRPL